MLAVSSSSPTKQEYPLLYLCCRELIQQVEESGAGSTIESFLKKTGKIIEDNYRRKYEVNIADELKTIDAGFCSELEDAITKELIKIGKFHEDPPEELTSSDHGDTPKAADVPDATGADTKCETPKDGKDGKGGTRKRHQCPMCPVKVKDLNRHIVLVHDAEDRNAAKKIRLDAGLVNKDKRPKKTCPECKIRVSRLDKHLPAAHSKKYPKKSVAYKKALADARRKASTKNDPEEKNAQPENAQQENAQPENAQQENAQPENAQQENAEPENAQPENAQPENAQQENAQPENAQPENSHSNESKEIGAVENTQEDNSYECNGEAFAVPLIPTVRVQRQNDDESKDPTYVPDEEDSDDGDPLIPDKEINDNEDADGDDYGDDENDPEEQAFQNSKREAKPWSELLKSKNRVEAQLAHFWKHVQRPEGGMKKSILLANEVTSKIYRLMNILSDTTGKRIDLEVFRDHREIWDNFVMSTNTQVIAARLKKRTIYKYILALDDFLHYLLHCKNDVIIPYDLEKELGETKAAIHGWKTALKPLLRKERSEKQVEKYLTQLTLKEVQDMNNSEAMKADKDFLANADCDHDYSLREHNSVRDFLVFMIVHSNAQRAGIGEGLTVEEFQSAQWREDERRYVILVKRHKTGYEGPASLVVTKETYRLMANYLKIFRPIAAAENPGVDIDTFFLTKIGTSLMSSRVSSIFNYQGVKYGRKDKGRLYPTKFRQIAASSARRDSDSSREDLSKLMTHKLSTQKQYYVLEDNIERSITAQKMLAKRFQCSESPVKEKKNDAEETDATADEQDKQGPGRPGSLTKEQETELTSLFSREITSKLRVTKDDIEERMQHSQFLHDLDSKKILSRIKYLASQEPSPELPSASECNEERTSNWVENLSDVNSIPPSHQSLNTISVGGRRYWDDDSERIVCKVYAHLFVRGARLPRLHDIQKVIKESEDEEFQLLLLALGKDPKIVQSRLLSKCKTLHRAANRNKNP